MLLFQLNIEPQSQQTMASTLVRWRKKLGAEKFDTLWQEEIGQTLPDAKAIQSAREKRPEAEQYFKSAQKTAADSSVPAEMRELGRVLSRIMAGDTKVDLSALPPEYVELIKKELG